MSDFSPNQKYVVFKTEDVLSYACDEVSSIQRINHKIQEGRAKADKKSNQYLVLNLDEPYAKTVLDLLELFGQKIEKTPPICYMPDMLDTKRRCVGRGSKRCFTCAIAISGPSPMTNEDVGSISDRRFK